tara:strand:+ start:80234 stop:80578 length:345 start_codon:yes stop_codon:yes gene_type:complete
MKNILTFLLAVVLTTTLSAQKKKNSDKAKKVATEMIKFLELDNATFNKVYELQSKKFAELKAANKELKEDKTLLKAKRKEINNEFKSKLNPLLGKEKVKMWSEHLKANKKNKKH